MSKHFRTYAADIRAKAKDGKTEPDGSFFEGHCAVLHSIDSYGTIMGKDCFDRDLDHFRTNGFIGGLNHNWNEPIGKPETADVDDKGLRVSAHILDTDHGLTVRKLLKSGVVRKLSFGFEDMPGGKQWLETDKDVRGYWDKVGYKPNAEDEERGRNGALLFTRLKVHEASPVMVPGNDHADISEVRQAGRADGHQPLEIHLLTVRAAVESLSDRLEQLAELRAGSGRSLPPERRAVLRSICDRIAKALAACQPRASAESVSALRRELFAMETDVLTS